ncbi:hypothetical protein [Streptomyces sp900116325]|uniref:Uncharacterized protein n=1 Tax=Streptomyces sp. 900116325 TaxID=3154295 RepID=A0ABV2UH19_9ACTN
MVTFDLAWKGRPALAATARPRRVHPVITCCVGALFFGGTMAVGIGRIYRPVRIWGLAMGVLSYLTAIVERKSMEHYGFLPRATPHPATAPEYREG